MLNFFVKSFCAARHPPPQNSPPREPLLNPPENKKSSSVHITDSQRTRFSLYPITTQVKKVAGKLSLYSSSTTMPPKKDKPVRKSITPPIKAGPSRETSQHGVLASLLSDLEDTEDYMTGQDPSTLASLPPKTARTPVKAPSPPPIIDPLAELGALFLTTNDSLSPIIMDIIDGLDRKGETSNPSLRSIYTKLVGLFKDDFWQIRESLCDAARHSLRSLYLMIIASITSYQVAVSKDIGTYLSDISALRDDMMVKSKEARIQEGNNRTFLESMTKSWNTISRTMTQYNELLEKKILDASTLQSLSSAPIRSIPKNTASSSTSRAETPLLIPGRGKVYKSHAGVIRFVTDTEVSFAVQSASYRNMKQLEAIQVKERVWKIILNADLSELNILLGDPSCCLFSLEEKTLNEKIMCIKQLQETLPTRSNQWVEMDP